MSKRSRRSLRPARRLWLMTKGTASKWNFRTSSPTIKTPRSLETSIWETRCGAAGNTLRWTGGSANWTSRYGARQLAAGLMLMTISRLKTLSLRVCIASMFTMRRGVCLWSWKSPSWRPISFLVSERLRRQGLQAALHRVRSFAWYRLEAKARPRLPRPRILEHVYGAVGRLPACALLRWHLLPSDGRHPP